MFKNPFSFNGRIRRKEFGISQILSFVYLLGAIYLMTLVNSQSFNAASFFLLLPGIWFRSAQATKRCHDLSVSGWNQFKPFYILTTLFEDSHFGPNEYGLNPKGIGNYDEIDEIGEELT